MTLQIAQSAEQEKPRRWRWRVWLEGPQGDLDQVERVVWLLHPTFSDPIRESTDRASGFRLEAVGWGEFKLRARTVLRDGKHELLEHDLRFEGESARAPRKEPVVFISHAAADASFARELSSILERSHVKALHPENVLQAGGSWEENLLQVMSGADAVVAVISGVESPWVSREVAAAQRMGIPVLPVRIDPGAPAPRGLENMRVIDQPELRAFSATELSRSVYDLLATKRSL